MWWLRNEKKKNKTFLFKHKQAQRQDCNVLVAWLFLFFSFYLPYRFGAKQSRSVFFASAMKLLSSQHTHSNTILPPLALIHQTQWRPVRCARSQSSFTVFASPRTMSSPCAAMKMYVLVIFSLDWINGDVSLKLNSVLMQCLLTITSAYIHSTTKKPSAPLSLSKSRQRCQKSGNRMLPTQIPHKNLSRQ